MSFHCSRLSKEMMLNSLWQKYGRKKTSNFSLPSLDMVSIIISLALSDIPVKHFLFLCLWQPSLPSFKTVRLIWLIQFLYLQGIVVSKVWRVFVQFRESPKRPTEIQEGNVKPLLILFHRKYETHVGFPNYVKYRLTLAHPRGLSIR